MTVSPLVTAGLPFGVVVGGGGEGGLWAGRRGGGEDKDFNAPRNSAAAVLGDPHPPLAPGEVFLPPFSAG